MNFIGGIRIIEGEPFIIQSVFNTLQKLIMKLKEASF